MHVGPGDFETMRIPIRAGREFTGFDRDGAPRAVILNETMARRLFGPANPVGQELRFLENVTVQVVGVAADSKYSSLGEAGEMVLYEAWLQNAGSDRATEFVVQSQGASPAMLASVKRLLLKRDASAAVEVKPIREALGLALLPSRAGALLLGGFGVLGLLLASVGLAGMIAYSVQGRTWEIGLRMAMGATPGAIFRLVAREASWTTGIGLTFGLAAAFFAVQPLAAFLVPGLAPADPLAFGSVVAVLVVVSLAAAFAPARRALGVEPLRALREE